MGVYNILMDVWRLKRKLAEESENGFIRSDTETMLLGFPFFIYKLKCEFTSLNGKWQDRERKAGNICQSP